MSFRRYIAANSRDALAQVRRELGEDAVILSNRRVPEGFEVVAAAARAMERLVQDAPATHVRVRPPASTATQAGPAPAARTTAAAQSVPIRADESFQEFVRRQSQGNGQNQNQGQGQGQGQGQIIRSAHAARPSSFSSSVAAQPAASRSLTRPAISNAAPGVPAAAARYRDVAQAPAAEALDEEDMWKPTTFHMPLSAALNTERAAAPPPVSSPLRQTATVQPIHSRMAPTQPHTTQPHTAQPHTTQPHATQPHSTSAAAPITHGASNRLPTRWASTEPLASATAATGPTDVAPAPAVFRRRAENAAAPQVQPQLQSQPMVNAVPQPAPQPQRVPQVASPQAAPHAAPQAAPQAASIQPTAQPAHAPVVPHPAIHAAIQQVAPAVLQAAAPQTQVLEELQAMRAHLQQQIASLSSSVASNAAINRQQLHSEITHSLSQISAQTQHSAQSLPARVMSRMLTAGFSPEVARKLARHVPLNISIQDAEAWLHEVITLNLKVVPDAENLVETGGAFAFVGPTGVGKTTTVAKLAARFAVKYGSGALGLITLDAYRIGAHEQLRTYGRILGTPVHLAQDGATLRDLVISMQSKRLVLIDSCGMSQRDGRLNEVLAMTATATQGVPEAMRIQRVLLANAASHTETLDEAARAWRAQECAGCIFTKLDEAVRIGGALDTALRYKLRLFGVTNGQRVPEDWHAAHARVLTHLALRPGAEAFALDSSEALAVATENAARVPSHV